MIIRDGRGISHDLGPSPTRFTTPISMMKMIGGTSGQTGTGRWTQITIQPSRMGPRPGFTMPKVASSVPCAACGIQFQTSRPEVARFCSDGCRWKIAKRASRAAQAATGDRGQGDALI